MRPDAEQVELGDGSSAVGVHRTPEALTLSPLTEIWGFRRCERLSLCSITAS